MILMSDYLGDGKYRNEIGYALAFHTAGVVGINFIKTIIDLFRSIVSKVIEIKNRSRRTQKYSIDNQRPDKNQPSEFTN